MSDQLVTDDLICLRDTGVLKSYIRGECQAQGLRIPSEERIGSALCKIAGQAPERIPVTFLNLAREILQIAG
jgi:hypothetical protein